MPLLEQAWRRADGRFAEVKYYVNASQSLSRTQGTGVIADRYGSWILLAYGACEFGLGQIGQAMLQSLAQRYPTPSRLPARIALSHRQTTLSHLSFLAAQHPNRPGFLESLSKFDGRGWSDASQLMTLPGNAWPDNVKSWLSRLGIESNYLGWMTEPNSLSGQPSETLESRLSNLVQERNPIAHGQRPQNLLSPSEMVDWVEDCRRFVESCATTMQLHFASTMPFRLSKIGDIDQLLQLGSTTLPFLTTRTDLTVGQHVLLSRNRSPKRIACIQSMMSNGISSNHFSAGTSRVAVTLNKPHGGTSAYLAP